MRLTRIGGRNNPAKNYTRGFRCGAGGYALVPSTSLFRGSQGTRLSLFPSRPRVRIPPPRIWVFPNQPRGKLTGEVAGHLRLYISRTFNASPRELSRNGQTVGILWMRCARRQVCVEARLEFRSRRRNLRVAL